MERLIVKKTSYNTWAEISRRLNNITFSRTKTREFWQNNLRNIQNLKASDIDDKLVHIIPSSVLLNASKFSKNTLCSVLIGWRQTGELNEIFYRIAGEGTPQSIGNTFLSLRKTNSDLYIKLFHTALAQSHRIDDFIENANQQELHHTQNALSKIKTPTVQERNTISKINQILERKDHTKHAVEISRSKTKTALAR